MTNESGRLAQTGAALKKAGVASAEQLTTEEEKAAAKERAARSDELLAQLMLPGDPARWDTKPGDFTVTKGPVTVLKVEHIPIEDGARLPDDVESD